MNYSSAGANGAVLPFGGMSRELSNPLNPLNMRVRVRCMLAPFPGRGTAPGAYQGCIQQGFCNTLMQIAGLWDSGGGPLLPCIVQTPAGALESMAARRLQTSLMRNSGVEAPAVTPTTAYWHISSGSTSRAVSMW